MKWVKLEETKVSITVKLMDDGEELDRHPFESIIFHNYVRSAAEYTVNLCKKEGLPITWAIRLFFKEYVTNTSDLFEDVGTPQEGAAATVTEHAPVTRMKTEKSTDRCCVTMDDDDATLDDDDDLPTFEDVENEYNEMDRLAGLPVKGDTYYHLEGIVGQNEKETIEIDRMFTENADLVMCIEALKMLFPFVSVHASEMEIKGVYFVDKR